MQDHEIILDGSNEWDIETVRNQLSGRRKYVIPTNIKYCFKHTECRGMSKCLGLVTVYWNRLLDWLCTI